MEADRSPVKIDEYVEAPPAEVFEYVADPARRPFGTDERVELGPEIGRDEPSRIEWQVTTRDGDRHRDGTVEIAVTPDGAGSRVRVTHRIGNLVRTQPATELALAA